jgi:hypothetical protein
MVASTTNPPSDEETGDKKYPTDSLINYSLPVKQVIGQPKENPCTFTRPMPLCMRAGGTLNRAWREPEKAAAAAKLACP